MWAEKELMFDSPAATCFSPLFMAVCPSLFKQSIQFGHNRGVVARGFASFWSRETPSIVDITWMK